MSWREIVLWAELAVAVILIGFALIRSGRLH